LYNVRMYLNREVVLAIAAGALFSWPVVRWFGEWREKTDLRLTGPAGTAFGYAYSWGRAVAVAAVMLFSAASIASDAYNPFIYFRF